MYRENIVSVLKASTESLFKNKCYKTSVFIGLCSACISLFVYVIDTYAGQVLMQGIFLARIGGVVPTNAMC